MMILFKILLFPFIVIWRLIVNVFKLLLAVQFLMMLISLVALGAGIYYLDHAGVISVKEMLNSIKK